MIFGLLQIKPASRRALLLSSTFALDSPFPTLHPKISLEPSRPPTDPKEQRSAVVLLLLRTNSDKGAFSVARRNKDTAWNLDTRPKRVEGERLKPIRRVMREIQRPDGTILRVEVPVYPPFKLKDRRKAKD